MPAPRAAAAPPVRAAAAGLPEAGPKGEWGRLKERRGPGGAGGLTERGARAVVGARDLRGRVDLARSPGRVRDH